MAAGTRSGCSTWRASWCAWRSFSALIAASTARIPTTVGPNGIETYRVLVSVPNRPAATRISRITSPAS